MPAETLVLVLLMAIILLIAEIAKIMREIEENGGQITPEEIHLAAQGICSDIRDFLMRKS
jgi:hypothetical protein